MQHMPWNRENKKQKISKERALLEKLDAYTAEMAAALIDNRILGRNAERDRKMLKRRLIDGLTYEDLAEEFCLSVRQSQNIIYRGTAKLLSVL